MRSLILEDFGGENPASSATGLPLDIFFQIAIQAAAGLGQIHDANIVHKDVKPSNLLVNAVTGQVKFIDFHLASELSSYVTGQTIHVDGGTSAAMGWYHHPDDGHYVYGPTRPVAGPATSA